MNSLLTGGGVHQEYRLYGSSSLSAANTNPFKRFSFKNEHRTSNNNNFSRQLLTTVRPQETTTTWAQYHQALAVKVRAVLQMFVFVADLYLLNLLFRFTAGLMSLFSGVAFALMYALFRFFGISMYVFANALYEVLVLLATLGVTMGAAYYVLLEQIERLIGLQKPKQLGCRRNLQGNLLLILSERTLSAFRLYTARCVDYIGDCNRIYGRALAFYYLFCYPSNAAVVVTLVFRPADWLFVAMASVNAFYQLFLMLGVHICAARLTTKLHRPARWLIGAEVAEVAEKEKVNNLHKVGFDKMKEETGKTWKRFRVRLQLANYIAHFHTDHQYAITYGKAGSITFRSFTRSIFYYLKFLIFAVKIYFEY